VGPDNSVGAIIGDLGFDAWFVDDDGTAVGTGTSYTVVPAVALNTQAATNGWTLRTRLRVVDVPDTPDGSPILSYRNGTTSYQMFFGTEADGDPIVRLIEALTPITGPTFTLEGTGGGYHLYELVYDPQTGSADLFVNGIEVLSDYEGFPLTQSLVWWGAGSSADTGRAHFNLVQFEVVPDPVPALPPAALLALAALLGAGGALAARRRRTA
jgi:hypothetical protein